MVLIVVVSNEDTKFPLINTVGDIELLQKISKISSYPYPYSNICYHNQILKQIFKSLLPFFLNRKQISYSV